MTKIVDNYSAFNEVNLSNARVGRDNFKEMFPNGILEAIKNADEKAEKANTETLGEVK